MRIFPGPKSRIRQEPSVDETSQHLVVPSNANQIKIEHNVFPAFVIKMPDGVPRIQLRDLPILDFVSSDFKVISMRAVDRWSIKCLFSTFKAKTVHVDSTDLVLCYRS